MTKSVSVDWSQLGFSYMKTPYRYVSTWKNGDWSQGVLTEDNQLTISEASSALHYGQQCFEGSRHIEQKAAKYSCFVQIKMQKECKKAASVF